MKTAMEQFCDKILERQVNLHSCLLMTGGRIAEEWYRSPGGPETKHRMFSVTKSLVSMAIGLLEEEGRLRLTDSICDYFPEYVSEDQADPWLKKCRIVDMLRMESCHSMTAYKQMATDRWTESFFRVKPDHCPGTVFSYDTSASLVMTALAEKLSGKKLLDYLREKVFGAMGILEDAYVLESPDGVSHGGSGLMCTTRELAWVGYLCSHLGDWHGQQLLPREYMRKALCYQTGTGLQGVVDERMGYGYQFWKNRKGGFVLYGMGGQLVMCFPRHDAVFVTTGFTYGDPAGQQSIYDAFYEYVYPVIENGKPACAEWETSEKDLAFETEAPIMDNVGKVYAFRENPKGWKSFRLALSDDKKSGCLELENSRGRWEIPFAVTGQPADNRSFAQGSSFFLEGQEDMPALAQAWTGPVNQVLLRIEVLHQEPGVLWMDLGFRDDEAVVHMKKNRELGLSDYEGFFNAGRISETEK